MISTRNLEEERGATETQIVPTGSSNRTTEIDPAVSTGAILTITEPQETQPPTNKDS